MIHRRYKERPLLLGTLLYRVSLGAGALKVSFHLEGFRLKVPTKLEWEHASDTPVKLGTEVA